jgi:hypothetical protein
VINTLAKKTIPDQQPPTVSAETEVKEIVSLAYLWNCGYHSQYVQRFCLLDDEWDCGYHGKTNLFLCPYQMGVFYLSNPGKSNRLYHKNRFQLQPNETTKVRQ